MKKLGVVFLLLFVIISANYSKANAETGIFVKKNDSWLLAGYNQNVVGEKGVTESYGPISGILGGDIGRFLAMELQLGGRIGKDEASFATADYSQSVTQDLSIFDAKLYLMLQSKFALPGIAFRPYIGVAPTFHYSKVTTTKSGTYNNGILAGKSISGEEKHDSYDFGVAAKVGLRMQFVKFIMLGINLEYQFHKTELPYKDNLAYDMSGFSVGAELGLSW